MSGNVEDIDPETDVLTGMFREYDEALATIQRVRDVVTQLESSASEAWWKAAQMVKQALDGEQ